MHWNFLETIIRRKNSEYNNYDVVSRNTNIRGAIHSGSINGAKNHMFQLYFFSGDPEPTVWSAAKHFGVQPSADLHWQLVFPHALCVDCHCAPFVRCNCHLQSVHWGAYQLHGQWRCERHCQAVLFHTFYIYKGQVWQKKWLVLWTRLVAMLLFILEWKKFCPPKWIFNEMDTKKSL